MNKYLYVYETKERESEELRDKRKGFFTKTGLRSERNLLDFDMALEANKQLNILASEFCNNHLLHDDKGFNFKEFINNRETYLKSIPYEAYGYPNFLEVKFTQDKYPGWTDGGTTIYCHKFNQKKRVYGWQIEVTPLANNLYKCAMIDTCTRLEHHEDGSYYNFIKVGTLDDICKWVSDEFECLDKLDKVDTEELNPNAANLLNQGYIKSYPEIAKNYIKLYPKDFSDTIKYFDETFETKEDFDKLLKDGYKPINQISNKRIMELELSEEIDKFFKEKLDQILFNNFGKDYEITASGFSAFPVKYEITVKENLEIDITIAKLSDFQNDKGFYVDAECYMEIFDDKENLLERTSLLLGDIVEQNKTNSKSYDELFSNFLKELEDNLSALKVLTTHDAEHMEDIIDYCICKDEPLKGFKDNCMNDPEWTKNFLSEVSKSLKKIKNNDELYKYSKTNNWDDLKNKIYYRDEKEVNNHNKTWEFKDLMDYLKAQKVCDIFLNEYIPFTKTNEFTNKQAIKTFDKFLNKIDVENFEKEFNKVKNDIAINRVTDAIEQLNEQTQTYKK